MKKKKHVVTQDELIKFVYNVNPDALRGKSYNAKKMYAKRILKTAISKHKNVSVYSSRIIKQPMKTEVFDTYDKGYGLRAAELIGKNKFIIEYVGQIINEKQLREKIMKKRAKFIMDIKNGMYIDAEKMGNNSRYINHACDPNAFAKISRIDGLPRILITALKDIKKGQEITFSYGTDYSFGLDKCRCNSCSTNN